MQETKENIRKKLYGFYIAYDLWLSNGAKPGGVFSRNYGLCANLFDYLTSIGTSSEAALEQLHADFRSAGLYEVLPFNESKGHYYEEKGNNMCHMNPARVAWVRAQIALASLEAEPVAWKATFTQIDHEYNTFTAMYSDKAEAERWVRLHEIGDFRAEITPLYAAPSAPVIPDGWISCSERMPEKNQNVLISVNFDSSLVEPLICSARYTGSSFRRGDATIKPGNGIEQATHWMPLPEPPQEVN